MKYALRELRANPTEHIPSILVVTIAALFGTVIVEGIAMLTQVLRGQDALEGSGTAVLMLGLFFGIFYGVALLVSGLVISNTFGIIIAGRVKRIALMRLVGASSKTLRRAVSAEGLLVGVAGSILGAILGVVIALIMLGWLKGQAELGLGDFAFNAFDPLLFLPLVCTIAVTWLSGYVGSAKALRVSPIQATGSAQEPNLGEARASKIKLIFALLFMITGFGLLLIGLAVGVLVNPIGVLIAFFGGAGSFIGLVLGSAWVMPPVQRLVSWLFGRRPAGRQAARNTNRHPVRTARTTMGLVIGITLIVMFATAMGTTRSIFSSMLEGEDPLIKALFDQMINGVMAFFSGLIAFSVVIAVIGVINNLSLSVSQRTRELGLLRAVGLSRRSVRGMVLAEGLLVTSAAALFGVLLGILYGWVGAVSMFGSIR
ncbi:MAG: ABC transporter permease, partial [Propionibacteriales bacterium]|nr:ABC transporter permease [Propionibacteriales bacterium]